LKRVFARFHFHWLAVVYASLGLACTLVELRVVLRLLAADELSPVGRTLVDLGGLVASPWQLWLKMSVVGQLPGSTYEPATLLAGLGYLGLAGLVALVVGLPRSRKHGQL
jgi:hypothetical protein